ncbi:MAG: DUF4330 domain-containing protein [Clostridia bacterium]|nr:DUF4330 domain-containing protein [Clostridia bacterium]
MIIDKKGKLFGKISIIDICVILVIIVGILGAYFTVSTLNSGKLSDNSKLALNSSSPLVSATVTFEVKGVRAMTKDALCEGDEVYETEDNKFIGTISKVTSKPAESEYIANDGTFYKAVIPEKYDVQIFVDVSGKNTQTGFHTESELQLLYGKEIEIKTPSVKTMPEIVGIEFKAMGE